MAASSITDTDYSQPEPANSNQPRVKQTNFSFISSQLSVYSFPIYLKASVSAIDLKVLFVGGNIYSNLGKSWRGWGIKLKSSCSGTQKMHNRVIILDYILGSCAVIVYWWTGSPLMSQLFAN